MNPIKYHFLKKFWHNKRQGWIVAAFLIATLFFFLCYRPAYKWMADFINDNLLLSVTIAALLLFKFVFARMFYISKINNGDINARGCANSSCQLSLLLLALLMILTLKCCRKYIHFSHYEETQNEMASSQVDDASPKCGERNI